MKTVNDEDVVPMFLKGELLSSNDLNIQAMFRYLSTKLNRPSKGLSAHTFECLKVTDEATFDFFKLVFNDDLKRMGLI